MNFSFLTPWVSGDAKAWGGKFSEGVETVRARGLKTDKYADGF